MSLSGDKIKKKSLILYFKLFHNTNLEPFLNYGLDEYGTAKLLNNNLY